MGKRGRPYKFEKLFDTPEKIQSFFDAIIESGKKGGTKIDFACIAGVDIHTFINWCERRMDLSTIVQKALTYSQRWTMDTLRGLARGNKGNARSLEFFAMNAYGWSIRRHKETELKAQVDISDTMKLIEEAFKK